MKHLLSNLKLLSVLTITCLLFACNKSEVISPATVHSESTDELTTNATLSPGIYKITKFIDDGVKETAEFKGYRFNFQADGDLIARTNEEERVEGTWKLNSNGTRLEIKISGTGALDGIDDDDWIVVDINSNEISLRTPDPDRVVFTRII